MMLYCPAAETGYEQLSGKSIAVFIPTQRMDEDGNPATDEREQALYDPSPATTADYLMLADSAIIAAYAERKMKPPVLLEDIMYRAKPTDVSALITAVCKIRSAWYELSDVIEPDIQEDGEKN